MSKNWPKMTFVDHPVTNDGLLNFEKIKFFTEAFFFFKKKFKTLNLTLVRNTGIGFTKVKI